MGFDQAAFDAALAEERMSLGLPVGGPPEPGLELAAGGRIIHFDPAKHPRDPRGRFAKVLGDLIDRDTKSDEVDLPGGTKITRGRVEGYVRVREPDGRTVEHYAKADDDDDIAKTEREHIAENIIDRDGDGKPDKGSSTDPGTKPKPKKIGPDRPAPGKPSNPHAGKGRTAWKEKARSRILNYENGKEILDSLDDDALDEAFDNGKSPDKWARDQIEAFEKEDAEANRPIKPGPFNTAHQELRSKNSRQERLRDTKSSSSAAAEKVNRPPSKNDAEDERERRRYAAAGGDLRSPEQKGLEAMWDDMHKRAKEDAAASKKPTLPGQDENKDNAEQKRQRALTKKDLKSKSDDALKKLARPGRGVSYGHDTYTNNMVRWEIQKELERRGISLSQEGGFDEDAFQAALAQERADRGLSIIDEARASAATGRRRAATDRAQKSKSKTGSTDRDFESKHPRGFGGKFIRAGGSGAPKPVIQGIKKKLGGELTEESIREFQKKHGLQVDGVIGHQTASAILGDGKAKVGELTKKDKRRLFITFKGK